MHIHICILAYISVYKGKQGKGEIYLFSATFAHTAFSGAVFTVRAIVQPSGSRPCANTRTLTCASIQPHVSLVCHLNGLYLHNPCKYMDYGGRPIYRPQRDRGLSWLGWLTHSGQFTHKVVT